MRDQGFSIIEALVGLAIFSVILSAVLISMNSSGREQRISTLQLQVMDNASQAIHLLRQDLRQISFVPGKPVQTHSFRYSNDRRTLLIRRSIENLDPSEPQDRGSYFVFVQYSPVPTGQEGGGFFLARTTRTASGVVLPGQAVNESSKIFRSFRISEDDQGLPLINFNYVETSQLTAPGPTVSKLINLLDVVLSVAAGDLDVDKDEKREGRKRNRSMLVSSTIAVQRPEHPYGFDSEPYGFAHRLPRDLPLEIPPGNTPVLAPSAVNSLDELPLPPDVESVMDENGMWAVEDLVPRIEPSQTPSTNPDPKIFVDPGTAPSPDETPSLGDGIPVAPGAGTTGN